MPNVMAALPNVGGALCSTPQTSSISTRRDSSNLLVADRFAAGLSQIQSRYPGRREVQGWSQTCRRHASSLLAS